MDLIVWYSVGGSISGFELYYDKNLREHVFIWQATSGYAHLAVDDGEQKPVSQYKETPDFQQTFEPREVIITTAPI
jgi:hypothetical protein